MKASAALVLAGCVATWTAVMVGPAVFEPAVMACVELSRLPPSPVDVPNPKCLRTKEEVKPSPSLLALCLCDCCWTAGPVGKNDVDVTGGCWTACAVERNEVHMSSWSTEHSGISSLSGCCPCLSSRGDIMVIHLHMQPLVLGNSRQQSFQNGESVRLRTNCFGTS
jgi:hypothetical protein